jgi:UDP-glucose 4-epimerase
MQATGKENVMAETILLTGGAGFIGSHTAEALLQAGLRVRVLDNFSTGKRGNLPAHPELEIHEGDIRDAAAVARAMRGVARVLHLAAQVSVQESVDHPTASSAINITGFLNVLEAARHAGVRRFVYASSAAVYGMPESIPLSESSRVLPLSPYGLEKSVNDQYAALYRDLYGGSSMGLRYFNVYGPRQDPRSPYAGVISKFFACIAQGKPLGVFGDGEQTRDFVYVKDVAEASRRALFSEANGVCNVATGSSVTLLDLIRVLECCVGRQLEVQRLPARAGDIPRSATRIDTLRDTLKFAPRTDLQTGLGALHQYLASGLTK